MPPSPLGFYSVCPALQLHFKEAFKSLQYICFLQPTNTCFKNLSYLPILANETISYLKGFVVSLEVLRNVPQIVPVS